MKGVLASLTATPTRRAALAVAALVALVLVPFAGNFGAWDPWETHYGEVARQMLARNDFISLWWPGSPLDHAPLGQFWSKPVLTFWLEALSLKLAGLEWAGARANELVTSFRPEWALRAPSMLLSACTLAAVFALVRRIAGKRAAVLSVVVLLTSPQWLLISRQAMTDLPFVGPMTIALCLAGLALLAPDESELPRRSWRGLSWPHAPAFYGFLALFVGTTLPQLVIDSVQLHAGVRMLGYHIVFPGVVPMLPYIAAFFLGLFFAARARNRRQLYLLAAWVLCALASLAKGPAGLAMPAIILGLYLVCAGRWRDILRLELLGGAIVFIACGFPWWHAMLIRHGRGFWNEFIGDNYINRAEGRNGDRGIFDYYLQWIGYGMFPWSGLAAVGALGAWLRPKTPRQALVRFAFVWLLVDLAVITLVNTKFHHYQLPALPAAAVLAAVLIDDVLTAPARWQTVLLGLVALPLTFACGRDLAAFPPRILWLFDYDYVLVPGTGRPWPSTALYGTRYEYGGLLWTLTLLASAAMLVFIIDAVRRRTVAAEDSGAPPSRGRVLAIAGAVVAALVVAVAVGPSTSGPPPTPPTWLWLIPAAFMLGALGLVAATTRAGAAWLIAAAALLTSAFMADRYMPDLGPHWSQKHVIASYYAHRHGPDEPLIVWNLYWRGENFYTRNEVYSQSDPKEKWAWVEPGNAMAINAWCQRHKGTRVFFLVERTKLESMRGRLPAYARDLHVVDSSNNKLILVETRI